MTGVQTLVPIMLDHVNAGRLTLLRFVDLTSAGPARLFGIAAKGRIAVGYDADLTVVDLKRKQTITDKWVASRAGWTPYDGVSVTGWPVGTLVRGRKVMWEGSLTMPAQGERVRLLPLLDRKFAVVDPRTQAVGKFRRRIFAVGSDELSESCEQTSLRHAIAVDAFMTCFRPGFLKIAQRDAFLLAIGYRLARVNRWSRCRHVVLRPLRLLRTPHLCPTRNLARELRSHSSHLRKG
jgi:hypothetical protein